MGRKGRDRVTLCGSGEWLEILVTSCCMALVVLIMQCQGTEAHIGSVFPGNRVLETGASQNLIANISDDTILRLDQATRVSVQSDLGTPRISLLEGRMLLSSPTQYDIISVPGEVKFSRGEAVIGIHQGTLELCVLSGKASLKPTANRILQYPGMAIVPEQVQVSVLASASAIVRRRVQSVWTQSILSVRDSACLAPEMPVSHPSWLIFSAKRTEDGDGQIFLDGPLKPLPPGATLP